MDPSSAPLNVQHPPPPMEQTANGYANTTHPYYYGRLWNARTFMVEYVGEFFGTMMLVMFGTAANCQYNLGLDPNIVSTPTGTYGSFTLGWASGIAVGVLLSGGHINPAVTLAMAVWRGFPWKKVPGYFFSQLMGGIVGAAIVYGNYKTAIHIFEGGPGIKTLKTAGFFGTVPPEYMTNLGCFWDEFIGTTLLVFGILAILDQRNKFTPGLVAVGIFVLFLGLVACFGMQTGFALNPARDLGPRILTAMVGYGGQVFSMRHHYWIWCPILAPFAGAQFGTFLFDCFLSSGSEEKSIVTFLRRRAQPRDIYEKDTRV